MRSLILGFLLVACASPKSEVTEQDLKRVLDRVAESRIQTTLVADLGKPSPSDRELFEDACRIYRLDVDKARELLRQSNQKLYGAIYTQ